MSHNQGASPMLTLRTPRKDDFFESRIEPKPKPQLVQLVQAVESLNQEISECDKEIEKWTWQKHRIKNHFMRIFRNVKA
jgi:hypothetical protein